MPLDTSSAAFLSEMARAGFKPIHESSPEEVRALGPALVEMYGVGPEVARVENHTVTTTDGAFGVRILSPEILRVPSSSTTTAAAGSLGPSRSSMP